MRDSRVHNAAQADVGDDHGKEEKPAEEVVKKDADRQPQADKDDLFLFVKRQRLRDGDVALGEEQAHGENGPFADGRKHIPDHNG